MSKPQGTHRDLHLRSDYQIATEAINNVELDFWHLLFVWKPSERAGFGERQEWGFLDHAGVSQKLC